VKDLGPLLYEAPSAVRRSLEGMWDNGLTPCRGVRRLQRGPGVSRICPGGRTSARRPPLHLLTPFPRTLLNFENNQPGEEKGGGRYSERHKPPQRNTSEALARELRYIF
jgi:hypothetical protein